MNLYRVYMDNPEFGDTYEAYVISADEKHAEKKARTVFWYGKRCPLKVEKVEMTEECIIGSNKWYNHNI